MIAFRILAVVVIGLAAFADRPAVAQQWMACAKSVADGELAANQRLHNGLANLIVANRADFREVALLNRDLQIAMSQARHMRLVHLLGTAPRKITLTGGLSRFSNFSWDSGDDKDLRRSNAAYARLETRIAGLKRRNDAHDDWSQMRLYARGALSGLPEYQRLMAEFQGSLRKLESQLSGCK